MSLDDVVVIPAQTLQCSETTLPQVSEISETDAFSKHLYVPEPTPRAKPKLIKTPAAISSGAWRKFYEDKENIKTEKQAAILKRKQEKLRGTEQKKIKRDVKLKPRTRKGRNNEKKEKEVLKEMCTECGDVLVSDTEDDEDKNLGCDFCQRWYHLKCTIFKESPYIDVMDKSFKCNACL